MTVSPPKSSTGGSTTGNNGLSLWSESNMSTVLVSSGSLSSCVLFCLVGLVLLSSLYSEMLDGSSMKILLSESTGYESF